MEKVIIIKLSFKQVYHVSYNPNNGVVTTTENINEASVYKNTKGLKEEESHYMAEKSVSEVMELIDDNRYKLIVIDDPAVLGTNLDWFFFNSRNFNFIITSQNFKYIEKYLEHDIDCIYYTETVPTPKVNEGDIPLINFNKDIENIKHKPLKPSFTFTM